MNRILLVLLAAVAIAAEPTLTVEKPWSRATAPSAANGAVFLGLVNTGDADVAITAAHSSAAERVELHGHRQIGSKVEMYRLERIVIPAKERTDLRPGGTHIMLLGLKSALKEGSTIALDLTVEGTAIPLHVEVPVLGIAAMEAEEGGACCHEP
jgi:periplasmic copper chaperone A